MSSEIGSIGPRRSARPRNRFASWLFSVVAGLLVAAVLSPAQAQQTRVAKCQACAAEAAIVNALGARMPALRQALDQTTQAVQAAVAAHAKANADYEALRTASQAGTPVAPKALDDALPAVLSTYAARSRAIERYRQALLAFNSALDELARATLLLNDCEARLCPALSTGAPPPVAVAAPVAPVPVPPGLVLAPRTAACVACADAAAYRNELAALVNQGEMRVQFIRNQMAYTQGVHVQTKAELAEVQAEILRITPFVQAGAPTLVSMDSLRRREGELKDRISELLREYGDLFGLLQATNAEQAKVYGRYLQADNALNACERLMCGRPQTDAAPVASPAPVQTATPPGGQATPPRTPTTEPRPPAPPPAQTPPQAPGDKRTSRAEVQIFGGFAARNIGLSQTGTDTFGGTPLVDSRSSSAAKGVVPAVGAFGRVYLTKGDPGDIAPAPRVFLTAGMLFTPGSTRGFDAAGINTVPLGEVRTDYSRVFVAPVMIGVRLPFAVGSTPVNADLMAGVAIGHETLSATLLREGGAAGSSARGESSGLFIDPIIGFGLSAPVAVIEGLGPVSVGAMGLAMIGTGGRSVRLQSPGFASQTYVAESRRNVTFYGGFTVTLGLF